MAQFTNPDPEPPVSDVLEALETKAGVSLSGDGKTALLAGSVACGTLYGVTPPQTRYCKTAALFSRAADGTWSQLQTLSPPDARTTAPLALSRNGSLALLGVTYADCGIGVSYGSGCGYVYQYARDPIPRSPILAPVTPVPTLGAAGLAGLALLLAAAGALRLRRRGAGA